MVTLLQEEMIANRKADDGRMVKMDNKAAEQILTMQKQAESQMQMMQKHMQNQITLFHQMITPLLDKDTTNKTQNQKSDSASIHSESHSAETTVTQTTQHDHNTRSKQANTLSTPGRTTPSALKRLTQPTDTLTRTPIDLFTQLGAPGQPPEQNDALMHEQQTHIKPNLSGLPPPPKKSLSAQKRVLENRKLNAAFDEVQSFQEPADSQGAASSGGL